MRVSDNYGDYGICGFYLMKGVLQNFTLEHFCFSCRIVGMGVEEWLYDRIGRPELQVSGEVLTDLSVRREVDWINAGVATALTESSEEIPQIVMRGGCELDSVAHYCQLNSHNVSSETNRMQWHVFLKFNTTTNLMLTLQQHGPAALEELHRIGFRDEDLTSRFWSIAPGGVGIFSGWEDLYSARFRHKTLGLELSFAIPGLPADLTAVSEETLQEFAKTSGLDETGTDHLRQFLGYIAQAYDPLPTMVEEDHLRANLHAIFAAFPRSARLFVLLPHARGVAGEQQKHFYDRAEVPPYNALISSIASKYDNIETIDVGNFVTSIDDCQLVVDHFDRKVYFKIYQAIMERLAELSPPVEAAAG